MPKHNMTVGNAFVEDTWSVRCSCGYKVTKLPTPQAAEEAVKAHQAATEKKG